MSIIILFLSTLTANVIANDKASRERDTHIENNARKERMEIKKDVSKELKEINISQTQILIALAEIKKDIQNVQ